MTITLYTASGCARCKMVMAYMDEQSISYVEKDMRGEGKEDFQEFYKANRSSIYRGPDGIEFPILYDGQEIRQGIGAAIAYLQSGTHLDGFFGVGNLRKEWINGIYISGGSIEYAEDVIKVLRYLKELNMSLELETKGANSKILEMAIKENLVDRVIMNILGDEQIYKLVLGENIDIVDIKNTMSLVPQTKEYKFYITVGPVIRENGEISYITPDEVSGAAKLLEEATGDKKNTLLLKIFNPKESENPEFKSIEMLSPNGLFAYRSKARDYQVFTDIEK